MLRATYLRAFSLILRYECFVVSHKQHYLRTFSLILSYECFAVSHEQPRRNYLRAFSLILSYECFAVSHEQPRSNYLRAFSLILSYECFAVSQEASYEHILCCILSYECFARDKYPSRISGLSQPEALVSRALSVYIYIYIFICEIEDFVEYISVVVWSEDCGEKETKQLVRLSEFITSPHHQTSYYEIHWSIYRYIWT